MPNTQCLLPQPEHDFLEDAVELSTRDAINDEIDGRIDDQEQKVAMGEEINGHRHMILAQIVATFKVFVDRGVG